MLTEKGIEEQQSENWTVFSATTNLPSITTDHHQIVVIMTSFRINRQIILASLNYPLSYPYL